MAAKPIKSLELHYGIALYNDPVFNNGGYSMVAKPIKTAELHYPLLQFLIILISSSKNLKNRNLQFNMQNYRG